MRKIKIFMRRAKRNIRKFINKHKRKFKPAAMGFAACLFFLILLSNIDKISGFTGAKEDAGGEETEETVSEDNITSLKGEGFTGMGGRAGYSWLYGSGNVPMEDVREYLIEADGSVYKEMNKKEQKEWLKDLYVHMGWEEEPDTVTKKEVIEIGGLCGFDTNETSVIFSRLTEGIR